jgi:hypothetical protein
MADIQLLMQRHSRKFLGAGILCISLVAALALAGQADSTTSMWSAKYSLSTGSTIKAGDLESVKVSLGNQAPRYFSSKAKLIGSFLTKNVAQGELISVSAITKSGTTSSMKEIPLGIGKSDLPANLRVGDMVDLYSIPIKDPKATTSLVATRIRVTSIDSQSQNIGGTINLLLSVDQKVLLQITDAIQMGRIVVVRNAF